MNKINLNFLARSYLKNRDGNKIAPKAPPHVKTRWQNPNSSNIRHEEHFKCKINLTPLPPIAQFSPPC